jgi:hypothetical protein
MTGRNLILQIATSCQDLDVEIPTSLLYRDSDDCVIRKDYAPVFRFINGKLMIEMNSVIENYSNF